MISQQNKGRLVLIAIASMFFLPILLSWYLNFFTDFKRDAEGIQHGILINHQFSLEHYMDLPLVKKTCKSSKKNGL